MADIQSKRCSGDEKGVVIWKKSEKVHKKEKKQIKLEKKEKHRSGRLGWNGPRRTSTQKIQKTEGD